MGRSPLRAVLDHRAPLRRRGDGPRGREDPLDPARLVARARAARRDAREPVEADVARFPASGTSRGCLVGQRGASFDPAVAEDGPLMWRSAKARNVGQLGPVVWPPRCWRKAISPSISAVSTGGNSAVPRSFLP